MPIQKMDHVGIIVDDLAAAIEFFVALGLESEGEGAVEGEWVDRVVGLEGVKSDLAMVGCGDGTRVELVKFRSPPAEDGRPDAPANATGIRHITFQVDDIDATVAAAQAHGGELVGAVESYRDIYRLCYVRGPEGIIVELAERLG
jgi:catechol 2,3-dioxygenase-like lactoylglutathione lyase family enzyme